MQDNSGQDSSLASWIMEKVDTWENWRKTNYDAKWDEYYRLWRGLWTDADQNRRGERSRIICPELAQSIETCVAELEDATFIRDRWIDVKDNVDGPNQEALAKYVDILLENFSLYGVTQAISETYFNGALYGTGIAKIVVEKCKEPVISEDPSLPSISFKDKYVVKLIPIAPRNFVIDPSARSIDEALGCAHVLNVPLNVVQRRIADGTYNPFPVGPSSDSVEDLHALAEFAAGSKDISCKIVEWHGLVPKRLISKSDKIADDLGDAIAEMNMDTTIKGSIDTSTDEMVEAIVTIVNDEHVAKAVANPFLFGDRSIVAYQHDTVPNRFWGRGVAEKGYNPQKALDAEVRARIDALGLSTHPMMGIDASKIPRGETFEVRPGRNILTNGPPGEALFPLKFQPPDPHTFQQTQELREMIQRATGGYELPAMMSDANRMAATSMSMVVGSMIKRSRRTLANIEKELLNPLVTKVLYRYMQFDSETFPLKDYKFRVRSSIGIMAREFEQGQLISLLSTVPQESPAYWMLIKSIYENSTMESREEMIAFADKMLEASSNPPPPPPDPLVQVEALKLQFEKDKHEDLMDLEAKKLMILEKEKDAKVNQANSQASMNEGLAVLELIKAEVEKQRVNAESFTQLMTGYAALIEARAKEVQASIVTSKNADGSTSATHVSTVQPKDVLDEDKIESVVSSILERMDTQKKTEGANDKVVNVLESILGKLEEQSQLVKENPSKEIDMAPIQEMLSGISEKVDGIATKSEKKGPVKIERDGSGLVTKVGNAKVKRDEKGLIAGLE